MTDDEKLYLLLLGRLLIEMRALEEDEAHVAKQLVDLFHNVPFALQSGHIRISPEANWQELLQRARDMNLGTTWLENWRADAQRELDSQVG